MPYSQKITRSTVQRDLLKLAPQAIEVYRELLKSGGYTEQDRVNQLRFSAAKHVIDKVVPNLKHVEVEGDLRVKATHRVEFQIG